MSDLMWQAMVGLKVTQPGGIHMMANQAYIPKHQSIIQGYTQRIDLAIYTTICTILMGSTRIRIRIGGLSLWMGGVCQWGGWVGDSHGAPEYFTLRGMCVGVAGRGPVSCLVCNTDRCMNSERLCAAGRGSGQLPSA